MRAAQDATGEGYGSILVEGLNREDVRWGHRVLKGERSENEDRRVGGAASGLRGHCEDFGCYPRCDGHC